MNKVARELIEGGGEPVTSLFIVETSSPAPNDQARKEFATFSRDLVSKMALAVIVAEGGDFHSALVRGVGMTLTSFMPHRVPFKFVTDLNVALELLAPHLPRMAGGLEGLRAAFEELRTALHAERERSPDQV